MRGGRRGADERTVRTLFGLTVPSPAALDDGVAAIGVRPALVGIAVRGPDFPREMAARINARGAVPVIAWTPDPEQADRWAAGVAGYRRPVLLRSAAPDHVRARFPGNALWIRTPAEVTADCETLEWDGVRAVMWRLPWTPDDADAIRAAVLEGTWLGGGDLAEVERAVTRR